MLQCWAGHNWRNMRYIKTYGALCIVEITSKVLSCVIWLQLQDKKRKYARYLNPCWCIRGVFTHTWRASGLFLLVIIIFIIAVIGVCPSLSVAVCVFGICVHGWCAWPAAVGNSASASGCWTLQRGFRSFSHHTSCILLHHAILMCISVCVDNISVCVDIVKKNFLYIYTHQKFVWMFIFMLLKMN